MSGMTTFPQLRESPATTNCQVFASCASAIAGTSRRRSGISAVRNRIRESYDASSDASSVPDDDARAVRCGKADEADLDRFDANRADDELTANRFADARVDDFV